MGQAGLDRGLARRVLPGAGGEHLAENDFVDQFGIDAGLGQQLADHRGAKVDGGNVGQCPLVATHGGPGGGNDYDILHGAAPHSYWIWRQNGSGPRAWLDPHGGIDGRARAIGALLRRYPCVAVHDGPSHRAWPSAGPVRCC
ncbi:hypothetical protein D3C81_1096960 [compost metagenome]